MVQSKLPVCGIANFIKPLSIWLSQMLLKIPIYHKFSGCKFIFPVLYVDDIFLACNDIGLLHETKRFLTNHFEMKDLDDASFRIRN